MERGSEGAPLFGPKHRVDLTGRDPCVVDTAPLSQLVRTYADGWRRSRPSLKGRRHGRVDLLSKGYVEPVGPYEFLASETGLPEAKIRAVGNPNRNPTTELRVAEAIVAAIGEPGMFYDGTLEVRPNPRARRDLQGEATSWACSTGSEGFGSSSLDSLTGSGSSSASGATGAGGSLSGSFSGSTA